MNNTDNTIVFSDVMDLARIVRAHRPWHLREQYKYALHPTIETALKRARPTDWHLLVLEWPHQSVGDHSKIAYTRDERKGDSDVQTVTTAGKYLKRHWPDLQDNVIRDIVAEHITRMEGSCKFLPATTEEIVRSVQEGPHSCMQWDEETIEQIGGHPYEVYDPELGWRAAVRLNNRGNIVGRALVHDGTHMRRNDTGTCVFVRSYKCQDDDPNTGGYSHADGKLEAWLKAQGVRKADSWPVGTPFRHVRVDHGPLLPYLDGKCTQVTGAPKGVHYRMHDGEEDGYDCNDTGGEGEAVDLVPRVQCACCDDLFDEEDTYYVDDEHICENCLCANYTPIDGNYVPDEHVERTFCGTVKWDGRGGMPGGVYAVDNGVHEGEYVIEDEVVCDIDGEFWHVDDIDAPEGVVRLCDDSTHAGEYIPRADAIACEDDWFCEQDVEQGTIVRLPDGVHALATDLVIN